MVKGQKIERSCSWDQGLLVVLGLQDMETCRVAKLLEVQLHLSVLGVTEPHAAVPVLLSACWGHGVILLNGASPEEHLETELVEQRQCLVCC